MPARRNRCLVARAPACTSLTLAARLARLVGGVILAAAASVPAVAQDGEDERKVTVTTRPKPELDPSGVRLGSFVLFPSLGLGSEYTDNVFKTDGDERDDFVHHVLPAARLVSDWSNHALELGVEADIGIHADHASEDYEDVSGWANGRLDVTKSTSVFGGVLVESLHEDRGSPDAVAGRRPTPFDRLTATLGLAQRFNRVTLEGEARFVELDFDDVRADGGGRINNDDRDRDVYVGALKLGYEIVPRYLAFVRGTVNRRDYHARSDDLGFERDSHGYDLALGTEFDLTGVTFGEVHVGYREQTYEDPRFRTLNGVSFGARLTSNITPITTLQLLVDREIEETSLTTAEGYWSTSVRLKADHELLRNLILSAHLGLGLADYEGIDREDEIYGAGLSATYQMNRHVGVTAGYRYEERASSGSARDRDYGENALMVRVNGRL